MSVLHRYSIALAVIAISLAAIACGGSGSSGDSNTSQAAAQPTSTCAPTNVEARLEPDGGVYYGVNLDWDAQTAAGYAIALGVEPAVYVAFAPFPLEGDDAGYIDSIVEQVRDRNAMLMLTLEPNGGLATVTEAAAAGLASRLADYNSRGVPVYLRFAHEMNGSWYAWSQQPGEYVDAFRLVAAAVHETAPATAMVWAPNYGGGYPFTGGKYAAAVDSNGYDLLDTNGDGAIDMADDPYAPYYPGDDAVDWVGMSLYHWGSAYPWGENEIPEQGKLVAQLTGQYVGFNGDDSSLPDFYADYAVKRGKPVSITETAAFYAPEAGGDAEQEIKSLWWQQVFAPGLHEQFPRLEMINWFEWSKFETEVNGQVDWTVTLDPQILSGFKAAMPEYLQFVASESACGP